MNIQLRMPPMSAGSEKEQLRQLHSYLRQTVEQLNWALGQLSASAPAAPPTAVQAPEARTLDDFETVKALIIKSSDIARASYEKTRQLLQLHGDFIAPSQFGTYAESLEQTLDARVEGIEQRFSRVEAITDSVSHSQRTQQSYLRFGLVGTTLEEAAATSAPGIEIGNFLTLEQDGAVNVQQRFARFTAYGLELFGSDSQSPVAYVSDRQLHIEAARVSQLQMGHFITTVCPDGSTVQRWVTEEE